MRAGEFGIEQKTIFYVLFFRSKRPYSKFTFMDSIFSKGKPSLIHINISRIIIPLIAAKIMGIPTIVHFRDVPSMMRYKPTIGWYFILQNYEFFKILDSKFYCNTKGYII